MDKKFNETLINSIKKSNYYNFFIKPKNEYKKNSKNKDKKRKIKIIQTINISPLTLSFEPDEKNSNNKNNLFNNIGKISKKINIFSAKFGNNHKYIRKGKLKFIKNKLSYSKISTNNTFESNNEKKINKKINGNKENDLFVAHKKIDFTNPIRNSYNKSKKTELNNKSYINFENSKKYKTIFTKYNSNNNNLNKNKIILEDTNYFFEIFSSKYNTKKNEEERKNIENNKLFKNEILNKAEFYKFNSFLERNKYFKTESATNSNNTTKHIKNENIINNPYILRSKKINLKLILQKIQNNPINNIPILTKFINKNKEISLDHSPLKKLKNINVVKYSPINLNMLAKIPNRLILIDNHGNEFNDFKNNKNNKNKLLKNYNNKFNDLKQKTTDIKILRKQFLDIYNSNNIIRNNSKKNVYSENRKINILHKNMLKTFYKSNQNNINNYYETNQKKNIFINNRTNYFSSEE